MSEKPMNHPDIIFGQYVYTTDKYVVRVVKMPDMDFATYAVINKDFDVIEQLQPILFNAKHIADQLTRWETVGPSSTDEIESLLGAIGGKSPNGRAN